MAESAEACKAKLMQYIETDSSHEKKRLLAKNLGISKLDVIVRDQVLRDATAQKQEADDMISSIPELGKRRRRTDYPAQGRHCKSTFQSRC